MKYSLAFVLIVTAVAASVIPDAQHQLIGGRILNGRDAIPHSAPYMIQLANIWPTLGELHNCGAVLLNSRWVLTAAHCLFTPASTVVVAGQHDVRVIETWEQRRTIERHFLHEDYCGSVCPNDIGLIYVNQPFVFDQYVQPIQLPGFQQPATGEGRLFGWGIINNSGPIQLANVLQYTDKPIITLELCQQLWGGGLVDSTNLCTGPLDGSTDACSADSGGPLVQFDANNEPIVVGLVSWGASPCGRANSPGVYVRVSAFIDWIYRTAGLTRF